MAYFDGRLSTLEPFINSTSNIVDELRIELEAIHRFLDQRGIPTAHPVNGHKLLIAQRLEIMFDAPTLWEPVKKSEEMGG